MTGYTSSFRASHWCTLSALYEDVHWLFLITVYVLNDIMQGEFVSMPNKLMEYLINVEEQT